MSVEQTIFGRLRKLLRVEFEVNVGGVTEQSTLGAAPMGFEGVFISEEFRLRLNEWFDDLIEPFPQVDWDETTKLGDIRDAIAEETDISEPAEYRQHVTALTETAFDEAAGEGAQSVPEEDRPQVQQDLNEGRLEPLLLRNVALTDLEGARPAIIGNIVERMIL